MADCVIIILIGLVGTFQRFQLVFQLGNIRHDFDCTSINMMQIMFFIGHYFLKIYALFPSKLQGNLMHCISLLFLVCSAYW